MIREIIPEQTPSLALALINLMSFHPPCQFDAIIEKGKHISDKIEFFGTAMTLETISQDVIAEELDWSI